MLHFFSFKRRVPWTYKRRQISCVKSSGFYFTTYTPLLVLLTNYECVSKNKHWMRSNAKGYRAKLTRLTHEIAIKLHLVAQSCTICSSRSGRPVRKLLDTPSYNNRTRNFIAANTKTATDMALNQFSPFRIPLVLFPKIHFKVVFPSSP
jgi:hypothetical protein